MAGAIAFSGKAIIVKLAYRHGVDAVTLIMLRMLFALPLFVALAWWAGRGKPALTARDWRVVSLLGFSGYYLASFLDFWGLQYVSASLERLILYLGPTLVLLLGRVLFGRRVASQAAAGAGHQLCRRAAGLRPGAEARRREHRTRRRAGLRQHAELCAVPGVQRRGGQAPGRAAPDRAGHQRGLRAVHRAVPAAAAVAQRAAGGHAGAVAVAAERHAVHLRAGADGDDGHRAHRRGHGVAWLA